MWDAGANPVHDDHTMGGKAPAERAKCTDMQRLKAEGQEPAFRESTERGGGRHEPPKQREADTKSPKRQVARCQCGNGPPPRQKAEPLLPSVWDGIWGAAAGTATHEPGKTIMPKGWD